MSAKISVEKVLFIKFPAVFLEAEALCKQVKVLLKIVVLKPKSGSLIPILALLSKSKIPYQLNYGGDDAETSRIVVSEPETKTKL
jgi:hypothetical protein